MSTIKTRKSYTVDIDGNVNKQQVIIDKLRDVDLISKYLFDIKDKLPEGKSGPEFSVIYHEVTDRFPGYSTVIQQLIRKYIEMKDSLNTRKLHDTTKKRKVDLNDYVIKSPISSSIILIRSDKSPTFNIGYSEETKFTNYWLRLNRIEFPLRGKRILQRISNIDNIKLIEIYQNNGKLKVRLTETNVTVKNEDSSTSIGLDLNVKRIVSSKNKIYSLKRYFHIKRERQKRNKQPNRDITNFSKDFINKLVNQIVLDSHGTDVLVLENLKGLRNSSSKKSGTSKGKTVNFMINNAFPFSMFKGKLLTKTLENNINLQTVKPQFTSQTCSKCNSLNTDRPTQSRLVCLDCGYQIDADLNAARNIWSRYTLTKWATSESGPNTASSSPR